MCQSSQLLGELMDFSLDFVENTKDKIASFLQEFAAKNKDLFYADVRFEAGAMKSAFAFNGNIKDAEQDIETAIGVRAFAKKDGVTSVGFVGNVLGEKQLRNINAELEKMLSLALKRAKINSNEKNIFKKKYLKLGEK